MNWLAKGKLLTFFCGFWNRYKPACSVYSEHHVNLVQRVRSMEQWNFKEMENSSLDSQTLFLWKVENFR